MIQRLYGRMNVGLKTHPSASSLAWSPFHSFFFHTLRHLLVEMCLTFKSTDIHNIFTVCHGVAIHHRFNHRTSPLPNFAMTFIDSVSFSNHRFQLCLEVVGAILWRNRKLSLCGYGFNRNLRRI